MTAAKATSEYEALSDDRWKTLTYGYDTYNGSSDGNSELLTQWMDATREILARMIHGANEDAEYTLLCKAEERVLSILGDAATDLVEAVETLRAAERKAAAA